MNKFSRLIIFILVLFISISQPMTMLADNAGGGGSGSADGRDAGGASQNKCGFRMYVVSESGSLKSKVIDLVYQEPISDMSMTTTRVGGGSASAYYTMPSGMPRPYFHNGSFIGNGLEVKAWMRSSGENGKQHIMNLIATYLGNDVAELFEDLSQEHYLVLEPIAFHAIYTTNDASSNSGVVFYGTFYNWMQAYSQLGLTDGGFTRTLDNNVLGRCLTLEFDQPNLGLSMPTSGGMLDLNVVGNQGFGIQLYSNLELKGQTTCNESSGDTPHEAPTESEGKISIVKNYRTQIKENEYTDDGCFTKGSLAGNILIEDEQSYTVKGWKISNTTGKPDSTKWESTVPGSISETGKNPQSVMVKAPSTCLYILLEKTDIQEEILEADYKLTESEITRVISLKKTDNDENIMQDYIFDWNYDDLFHCGGHWQEEDHDDDCEEDCDEEHGYNEYCDFELDNTDWKFKLLNSQREAFPTTVAFNSFWCDWTNKKDEERETLESGTVEVEDRDYKLTLHRGSDSLSIAEFMNTNPALDSLETFNTLNKKEPTRKKADYTEGFSISLVANTDESDLLTTSTGDWGCHPEDEATLSNPISKDLSVLYETYSGTKNGGRLNTDINRSEMMTIGTSGNKIVSGKMVESGLEFSYHPYIKMQYSTMDSEGSVTDKQEVFILGEYLRSMKLNDYAEIEWQKKSEPNMELISSQWNNHATAKEKVGTDSLLPGGARMSLGIKKDNRQEVTVRTYQCILEGDGRTQVEKTWNSVDGFTQSTAANYHTAYVNSIVNGLENLSVEQWQNREYTKDPFKGIVVYNEANISELRNTDDNTASKESKYYFKNDRGTADSGCLDVEEGNTSSTTYTFSSDTSGNILMNDSVILTKDQGVESLSGMALAINSRTLVITKLVDSIERNTGSDSTAQWVGDGHWYNEAFNGITVVVNTTKLKTGYLDPRERTCILDPKLNVKSTGQSQLFNGFMVGQFKMRDFSAAYGSKEVLGEFKGNPVRMKDMDWLYKTKKFYLSSISTQDLH